MKTKLLIAMAVCVIVASGAWAQMGGASPLSPRTLGMSAGLATVDDAGTWAINPASLATLKNSTPAAGKDYASDVMAIFGTGSDIPDQLGLTWSGFYFPDKLGMGAGYFDVRGFHHEFGAGLGKRLNDSPLTLGANFEYFNGFGTSLSVVNLAANYDWKCGIRTSLLAEDVFSQMDDAPFFDFGAAKQFGKLLLAADVLDITDQIDTVINGGAEYCLTPALKLRAGMFDSGDGHDLSAGLGYQFGTWRIDGAYQNVDGNPWYVSLGHTF